MGGGVGNNSTKCKYSRITTHTNLVNRNTSFKNFCLLSERLAKDVLETRWRWLFLFRREVASVSRCEEHVAGEVMKKLYSYSLMEMHFGEIQITRIIGQLILWILLLHVTGSVKCCPSTAFEVMFALNKIFKVSIIFPSEYDIICKLLKCTSIF